MSHFQAYLLDTAKELSPISWPRLSEGICILVKPGTLAFHGPNTGTWKVKRPALGKRAKAPVITMRPICVVRLSPCSP